MQKNGQSIVEYILIAVLVILGVVFMGGYVLRSINAHYKLWDEGVRESEEENLNQAPVNNVPNIPINCQCTPVNGTCGSNQPGSICTANERVVTYNCSIQGCNGAAGKTTCTLDPTCCTTAQPINCGTAPLPSSDTSGSTNIGTPVPCPAGVPGGSTCYQGLTSSSGPCYYGQQIYGYECGANASDVCVPVSPAICPPPICTGGNIFTGAATYCLGAETGLLQNTPNYYVGNSESNCSSYSGKCGLYCNPPYVVTFPPGSTDPTQAYCALQFYVAAACCGPDLSNPSCVNSYQYNSPGKCTNTPGYGGSVITTNTESFSTCAISSTAIASASAVPEGSPATDTYIPPIPISDGGCGNPGIPGQQCDVVVSYGSSS